MGTGQVGRFGAGNANAFFRDLSTAPGINCYPERGFDGETGVARNCHFAHDNFVDLRQGHTLAQSQTKTVIQITGVGMYPGTRRYSRPIGFVVIVASTLHPVCAHGWTRRIGLMAVAVIIGGIPIVAFLGNIARHIVNTQGIGLPAAHHMGSARRVLFGPGHRIAKLAAGVFISLVQGSAAGSVFPLGFGGQHKGCSGQGFQLINKYQAFVPTYVFYGILIAVVVTRVVIAHHGLPKLLSDFVFADVIGRQTDCVDRFFVVSDRTQGK